MNLLNLDVEIPKNPDFCDFKEVPVNHKKAITLLIMGLFKNIIATVDFLGSKLLNLYQSLSFKPIKPKRVIYITLLEYF